MQLTVGNKIVYPGQGPCLISPVVVRVVDGKPVRFYRLALLDGGGGELFIPVDRVETIGVRQLLKRSEIPKLLARRNKTAGTVKNWRQRGIDNSRLFASGSVFDLAEVVESLTELSGTRALLPRDGRMLERARKLLISEISEVMGETRDAAEKRLDGSLKMKKPQACVETENLGSEGEKGIRRGAAPRAAGRA